jgi:hypothetical protein
MSTCNRLDLQTLGSQLVTMPKISPIIVHVFNKRAGCIVLWLVYTMDHGRWPFPWIDLMGQSFHGMVS